MDPIVTVAATIMRHGLCSPGETIVVAVSGGPDSVGLLEILTRLAPEHGWQLHVATFDHRWRPGSELETEFVERLAEERGWDWTVGCAEPVCLDEAGAREARLSFLRGVAYEAGATVIATGHTADDRVETMLMNLLRGAGTTGLAALGPATDCFVRPLIELPREVLREWVDAAGLPYVEDPTNLDPAHFRNRVRHELLPALEVLSPGASARLRRAADVLGSEAEVLTELAETDLARVLCEPSATDYLDGLGAVVLDLRGWPGHSPGRTRLLLREALRLVRGDLVDLGLNEIEALVGLALGRPDAGVLAVGGAAAVRSGRRLVLLPEPFELAPWGPVPIGGAERLELPGCGYSLVTGEAARWTCLQTWIAADVLARGAVRSRRRNDTLRPAGRGGSRKVSDLMGELHIPRVVRDRVPLLVLDNQVVWLPGAPVDERYAGDALVGVVRQDP